MAKISCIIFVFFISLVLRLVHTEQKKECICDSKEGYRKYCGNAVNTEGKTILHKDCIPDGMYECQEPNKVANLAGNCKNKGKDYVCKMQRGHSVYPYCVYTVFGSY